MALCRKNFCSAFEQKFFGIKPFFIFLLLLCANTSVWAENATKTDDFKVYETLKPGKALLSSPQFIVIDDFNSGKFKNKLGATWQIKSPTPGAIDIFLDKDDARSQHRGYSLKASFNLLKNESASFQSFLEKIDVSQAEYLVMLMKLNMADGKQFTGRIRLTVSDWKHRSEMLDITDLCNTTAGGWQKVVLPLNQFLKLDRDQLFSIRYTLIAKKDDLKGDFWIDELAFFGFNDVAFESHRDNLVGFPKKVVDYGRAQKISEIKDNKEMVLEIAKDTWKYFENATDKKTGLVVDHIRMGDNSLAADYTSPTNIAMDIIGTISAMDLGIITKIKAEERVKKIFDTLKKLRRYKGFFYNFYETKKLSITRSYISSVDSGWLAIALVVSRQAFPGKIADAATKMLSEMNFDIFLDPEVNHLLVGIEVPEREVEGYHYGMLISEARATSLLAIGKGDIKPSHWWFLYRTPPDAWKWQNQYPKGMRVSQGQMDYFQGYYVYKDKKFVPSWGGSLFEYLMPTLVLKENKVTPQSFGLNNRTAVEIQRDYALKIKNYPIWGISPAATADGRKWKYSEFGVKFLGVKGYPDLQVITPHVSFLALDALPEDALVNIRKMLQFDLYGEYGFFDAIDLRNRRVNTQYLALDQGMILVAICNYLKNGSIQERFHADSIGKRAESMMVKESFFST